MTFFNKKEEVLEIKLTSFGKRKLANGKFKPTYYAFFDDDILYDAARAGVTEDNNDIETRIQENTPSLRAQTSFTDLEKLVMKQTHDVVDGVYHEGSITDFKHDPSVYEDYDGLRNVLPIGTSQLGNQRAAAWKIDFLEGTFISSQNSINDDLAKKPVINIPQINCDVNVQPVITTKNFKGIADNVTGRYIALNSATNQFLRIEKDYILLDVAELNVDLSNDSFSLEVYEIDTDSGEEVLKPKVFRREIQSIVNGILLDDKEVEAQISTAQIDTGFVEYYFDVSVDDGIDNHTKQHKIHARESKGSIFDNNVGFDDYSQTPGTELYTSDNDGEDC